MGSESEMSMFGELKFFLGLQVKQTEKGTMIHQQKYIKQLLKRFEMDSIKTNDTFMETATRMDIDKPDSFVDKKKYMLDPYYT